MCLDGGERTVFIAYKPDRVYKDVGTRRQLFIDDDIVAVVKNVTRRIHAPEKHPSNPLIQRDRPWEVVPMFRSPTYGVQFDSRDNLYKCWYEDYYGAFSNPRSWSRDRVYYATSEDGISWKKPNLGKLEVDGRDTNACFSIPPYQWASCITVIQDPSESDPSRRYKIAYYKLRDAGIGTSRRMSQNHAEGLSIAFSPDGIDWTPYEGNPLIPEWGSDVEVLTYDPIDQKYLLYGRYGGQSGSSGHPDHDAWFAPVYPNVPAGMWGIRRRVYRLESRDCINWVDPTLMFNPGPDDNVDDSYYCFVPWRAEEMHLGLLCVLHQVDNEMDVYLHHSRDGLDWKRFVTHRPFIPRGPAGSYDRHGVEMPIQPLEVGDELRFYYGGMSVHHDFWYLAEQQGLDLPEAHDPELVKNGHTLNLATLRRDGYVSFDAGIRNGYVETKPMFSAAPRLFINGKCAEDGYIAVEIMDGWGNVWDGYGRDDCRPFSGDDVNHQVSWSDGGEVNKIPGSIKLRFHLRNAELYGFQFAEG